MVVSTPLEPFFFRTGLQAALLLRVASGRLSASSGSGLLDWAQWIRRSLASGLRRQGSQALRLQPPRVGPGRVRLGSGPDRPGPEPAPVPAANRERQSSAGPPLRADSGRADDPPERNRCSAFRGAHHEFSEAIRYAANCRDLTVDAGVRANPLDRLQDLPHRLQSTPPRVRRKRLLVQEFDRLDPFHLPVQKPTGCPGLISSQAPFHRLGEAEPSLNH